MTTVNDSSLTGKSKQAHNKDIAKNLGLDQEADVATQGSEPQTDQNAQASEPAQQQQPPEQTPTHQSEQQAQGAETDDMHTPTYRPRQQDKVLDKQKQNDDIKNEQASDSQTSGDAAETGGEEPPQDGNNADDPFDKYSRMASDQFKGDPRRAAKSYAEAQREWMLERNKRESLEREIQNLEQAVQSDPELMNRLRSAYQNLGQMQQQQSAQQQAPEGDTGQQAGSHLTPQQDQQGNAQHGSTDVGRQSQPQTQNQNATGVTEQELAQKGYLDPAQKGQLSPVEWREKVIDAKMSYMNSPEYLNQYAQRVNQAAQQQQQAQQRQQQMLEEQRRLTTENERRITDSYDKAVSDLNLDLVSNNELLGKIKKEMQGFRDPDDGRLFREDAFYMAAKAVLDKEGGTRPSQAQPSPAQQQPRQQGKDVDDGFNRRKSNEINDPSPKTDNRPKSQRIWDEVDSAHKQVSRNRMRQNYTARPAPQRK